MITSRRVLHGVDANASPTRLLRIEPLEDRRMLSARAVNAINAFGLDLYEHLQHEEGNLFFSPLSMATGLTMAYAGASGQTAAEMQQVLHLGAEPGIHDSFGELLAAFEFDTQTVDDYELLAANAAWPREGIDVQQDYLDLIATDYRGLVQSLDYSDLESAKDTINQWVEEQTRGKIEDFIDRLDPSVVMVLTNAVYLKGLWDRPFDPDYTVNREFNLTDGAVIEVPTMMTEIFSPTTVIDGHRVVEMPLSDGTASMLFVLPPVESNADSLSSELIVDINDWSTNGNPGVDIDGRYRFLIPKFEVSVSTEFNALLQGLGMPAAFDPESAEFPALGAGYISSVIHKADIEVNEQGTEAAAATKVEFAICFAAGTPVMTSDGEKPIEELKAGDLVLARDEHNLEGPLQEKPVERLLTGHADILELHVAGATIRTTEPHLFFVRSRGWTPAGDLLPGDLVSTDADGWAAVQGIVKTGQAESVYNLRVADHRTYFIGGASFGFGVWVHNDYGDRVVLDRPFHFLVRDNETSTILFMGRMNDPRQTENSLNPSVAFAPADFSGDGVADGTDFLIHQRGHGIAEGASRADGDANGDGKVNEIDLDIWESAFLDASANTVRSATERPRFAVPTRAELVDAALAFEVLESSMSRRAASVDDLVADAPDDDPAALIHTQPGLKSWTPVSRRLNYPSTGQSSNSDEEPIVANFDAIGVEIDGAPPVT